MKRLSTVILLIVILGVTVCGLVIYRTLYVVRTSEPPPPIIISYSEDYWRGLYSFGFAQSEAGRVFAEGFIVVMDHQGNYLNYYSSSDAMFN